MSKRKDRKSKKPNIPQSTLERARKQAAGELSEDAGETVDGVQPTPPKVAPPPQETRAEETVAPDDVPEKPKLSDEAVAAKPRSSSRRSTRRVSQAQIERSKKKGELDTSTIEYALAHPTVDVSEEELHAEYGHVLVDLRNMGLLAAVLLVVLVLLAQFL